MRGVFINCPFDGEYQRLFRALVFVVQDCGFVPRCALERDDGSEVRIEKIRRLIEECQFGVHDISRTELDPASDLPRFNMPLELGMFLGAKFYGAEEHRSKACVIFDRERYRYQVFCSDIAGQDVRAHAGDERELIRGVRDAVRSWTPARALPGAGEIWKRYERFVGGLGTMAEEFALEAERLTFNDLYFLVNAWLGYAQPASSPDTGSATPDAAMVRPRD